MTDKLDDVWATRDFPVLREVTRRIDSALGSYPTAADIAGDTGIPLNDVQLAGYALERRGLVELMHAMGGFVRFKDVAGAAYLMTGLHPDTDDALAALVQILEQASEQVGDEDDRGRLKRAASALAGMSREVSVGVLSTYLAARIPV